MQSIETMLAGLDRQELVDWADSTIYSRGKSYVSSVSELSCTEDGRLVAWVSGSDEYVTTVRRDGKGDFDYSCTCPYDYGGPCKHVVAVLLAAAKELKKKKEIPLLDPESDLYWEASEYLDDEPDDDDDMTEVASVKQVTGNLSEKGLDRVPNEIRPILEKKSREELLEIIGGLARDYSSVKTWIQEREQMAKGKIDPIVRSIRKEIRDLTGMDAWSSEWNDDCSLPDYSNVEQRMEAMLDEGYADAVLLLGEELWERGNRQISNSNDEGETAQSIGDCMKVVLKALPDSGYSRVEQLIWLLDHYREDEFDLLYGSEKLLDDPRYTDSTWRELASIFEKRLLQMPVSHADKRHYNSERRALVFQLREACERAHENEKVLPLLEREAEPCQCYETLAEYLIRAGDFVRARFWCIEGYGKLIEDAPGIAASLKNRLLELAEKEGKHDLVAAYRAQNYFEYPSIDTYTRLRDSAEKIALWPIVHESAMEFLRSGKVPVVSELPAPEVRPPQKAEQNRLRLFPHLILLIEIAILEKRQDDVISLFKELCDSARCDRGISEKVAEAVATTHPETSLKIWRITVDNLIAQVKPHAYQEAAGYLLKMRKVLKKSDRLPEWNAMIDELRTRHKPKRRLMEVLKEVEQAVSPKA
jgi:uncharacterized Zn finger protein